MQPPSPEHDTASIIRRLRSLLERPQSPYRAAYLPELSYGRHLSPPPHDARKAAVLAVLYPHQKRWWIPVTVRTRHLPHHAGQVCLPGGSQLPGEEDIQCALREWQEEMGSPHRSLQVVGRLPPLFIYASNFQVTPVVAIAPRRPDMIPQLGEVERIVELDVAWLTDDRLRSHRSIQRGSIRFVAPEMHVNQNCRIWGATSILLDALGHLWSRLGDASDTGD